MYVPYVIVLEVAKKKRWSFDVFCPLFWRLSFRVLKLFFFRKNSSHTDVCCLKQPAELFQRPSNRQHFPPWTLKKRTKAPRNASCLPTQADKRSPSQDPSADRWGASILFSPQTSLIYPCKTSLLHGLQDFLHILLVCLGLVKRQVGSPSFLAFTKWEELILNLGSMSKTQKKHGVVCWSLKWNQRLGCWTCNTNKCEWELKGV